MPPAAVPQPVLNAIRAGLNVGKMLPLKDSAILLVWRPGSAGREVLWLRRGAKLAFGAGFYAFPGGKIEAGDASVPIQGSSPMMAPFQACAVRECFEETGLLVARGAEKLAADRRRALRAELTSGKLTFAALLAENGLSLHAKDLIEAGRWVTPPFMPVRFDARMFLAEA